MDGSGAIRLRFTTIEDSFVSWTIRTLSFSDWSHCELLVPGPIAKKHASHEGYLGSHFENGVLLRPFNYDDRCRFHHADVRVSPEVQEKVFEFAYEQIGKPYDLTGVFGAAFHRDWQDDNAWFCSELIAAAFAYARHPLLNPQEYLHRVTPGQLYSSPLVMPVQADRPAP
jgi:hypothetical protein